MEFKYVNLDNNKEIEFKIDDSKKIVAIYGKNGVGKTTLVLMKYGIKNYVFNDAFIRENIYVTSNSGVSSTVENNKNLTSLFIGKDIIELQKKQERLEINKKEYKDKINSHIKDIQDKFEIKITETDIISIIKKYLPTISELAATIKYDELDDTLESMEVETSIEDDNKFIEMMGILNSQEKLQSFILISNKNKVIKQIIVDGQGLKEYHLLLQSIAELKSLKENKEKNKRISIRKKNGQLSRSRNDKKYS